MNKVIVVVEDDASDEKLTLLAFRDCGDEDVLCSYSLGANAYFRKPVEFVEFAKAARTLGLFWLLLNEPAPRGTA